ncbi:MAG: ribosomal biogenesis protein, partial [Candidatus Thermoplasmatota archaeon]|nr:ribosomal biogenesis protein [Candidatus Thermoplasmatota archaeon]
MCAWLITKWFGTFIVDNSKVIAYKLFPKVPSQIAERLKKIDNNEILEEEKELAAGLSEGIYVTTERLLPLGKLSSVEFVSLVPEQYSYSYELLQASSIELAKSQLKEKIYEDQDIIQAVRANEEIIKAKNLFLERFREWYGHHFPTCNFEIAPREFVTKRELRAKLGDKEFDSLANLAATILSLDNLERSLESYIDDKITKLAPNLAEVATPILAAKLIAASGGLHRLSVLPASTIQLLGAEKALFRALRKGARTPKYGLIFQHPKISQAPVEQRGKLARWLGNKIAIAARLDYFSKKEAFLSFRKRKKPFRERK